MAALHEEASGRKDAQASRGTTHVKAVFWVLVSVMAAPETWDACKWRG